MSHRLHGRRADELRPITLRTDFTKWAEGSVLCAFGDTQVLCNASVEERVPPWLSNAGKGWVTAEYAMLPRSTDRRMKRESLQGRVGGRTHEISRLIGRSLRAAVDLTKLGDRTITIDCDVIQADGGTRTAAITGGWVALALSVMSLRRRGLLKAQPMVRAVAAVSLGLVDGAALLDLDFDEDQRADTDLNLVMTNEGGIVEVQGTAEGEPFQREALDRILDLGRDGIKELIAKQQAAIAGET
jgi:ribonuclease PH